MASIQARARLDGRVAAITGGGRGFGAAIVEQLADLGAACAVLDLSLDAAEGCARKVGQAGGRALPVKVDVSDVGQVDAAFARIEAELGAPDILVNNAGVVSSVPFLELDDAEWDRVYAIDYTGVYHCCHAVIPGMKARGSGRIVNVGSVAGARGGGFLGTAAYASAKAGVAGLSAGLATELAPFGITVNTVAPGSMETEMTRPLRENAQVFPRVLAGIPLGRQGAIRHVADAVAFLASDLAALISGETLNVDGGVTMK